MDILYLWYKNEVFLGGKHKILSINELKYHFTIILFLIFLPFLKNYLKFKIVAKTQQNWKHVFFKKETKNQEIC